MPTISALTTKRTEVTKRRIKAASQAVKPATTAPQRKAKTAAKKQLHALVTEQKVLTHQIEHRKEFEAAAQRNATAADRRRTAKAPGKRVSKTGHTYYESRTNRADGSRTTKI